MSDNNCSSSPSSPEQREMSIEEMERRILELKAKIKKAKKRARGHEMKDKEQVKQQTLEKTRETVEEQFHTIMNKFNARGFIYSFHHEDGTIVTGASDSLNDWWKDEIRSYQENLEGTTTGASSSIDISDSDANDQILPDDSCTETLAPKDCEEDESP